MGYTKCGRTVQEEPSTMVSCKYDVVILSNISVIKIVLLKWFLQKKAHLKKRLDAGKKLTQLEIDIALWYKSKDNQT